MIERQLVAKEEGFVGGHRLGDRGNQIFRAELHLLDQVADAGESEPSGDRDQSAFNQILLVGRQIEAGTVRGLAVTSLARSPYFPDLPSVHETTVPNFLVETWNGIIAPPNTPEPIIKKLSEILIKMADDPEIKATMRKAGGNTVKTTPEEFRMQIANEMAQWKPMVAEILAKESEHAKK